MLHVDQFSLLALGVVISIGMGFLLWTLYHLIAEAHPQGHTAHLPESRHLRR
ncbi:MAG TPA: hypothetical protein VHX37_01550 [Acidobacteriaceae bacterium]|jgi:hypothetical protein|nr:hypothetical protein [Acidobacteriaceae bacterium]